jgi:hypothetical protein
MAKATNVNKTVKNKLEQDESVLSTLVSVQDAPINKLIYTCLKLVQDEPVIWRRSTLVSKQDEPVIWRRSTLVSVKDEPVIYVDQRLILRRSTLVSKQDEPVLWCRSTLVSEQNRPTNLQIDLNTQRNSFPKKECTICKKDLKKEVFETTQTKTEESETMSDEEEVIPQVIPQVSWVRKVNPIIVERYSEQSFVVRGDTFVHKTELSKLGGRWNPHLTDTKTKTKFGAWVFPNSKTTLVDTFINGIQPLNT